MNHDGMTTRYGDGPAGVTCEACVFLRPKMAARASLLTVLFSCDRAQESHQPREPWSVLMTACGQFRVRSRSSVAQ